MSDWLLLADARHRVPDAKYRLGKFLTQKRAQITAKRSDRPFGEPEPVETLLAEAEYVEILDGSMIRAHPHGDTVGLLLTEVRVHWPQLAAVLESAGVSVPTKASKPDRLSKPANNPAPAKSTKRTDVQAYIAKMYPRGIPGDVSDKVIAKATNASERTVRRARQG